METDTFLVGAAKGLQLEIPALLEVLAQEPNASLSSDDIEVATEHLRKILAESVADNPRPERRAARIGEGRYVAVGALSRLGVTVILGPVLHVVAAGAALSSARSLLEFDRKWRPRVVTLYARLDGREREVFEVVHAAQNAWVIVNYDAEAQSRFNEVYGHVAPTPGEIASGCMGRMSESEVRDVLAELHRRRILDSDGTRYWIRF
jgi:hypothetical protein